MKVKFILILLCLSAILYGQDEEEWSTRLLMIRDLSQARGMDEKELALKEAERFLAENPVEEDRERVLGILTAMVHEGLYSVTYEGNDKRHPYSTARAKAAELLGNYGGEKALRTLVEVLFYGNDPFVMGSAAIGAASMNIPDKDNVITAFSRILNQTRDVYSDEMLIQNVLIATGRLGEDYPEVYENEGIMEGLNLCARAYTGFSRNTRNMALELIRTAGED